MHLPIVLHWTFGNSLTFDPGKPTPVERISLTNREIVKSTLIKFLVT